MSAIARPHKCRPLRALEARRPDSLPSQPGPFFGRDHDVAAARRFLLDPDVRLLTVTGPGGSGKTRLALYVAQQAADQFLDGAVHVDLAHLADPAQVIAALFRSFGEDEPPHEVSLSRGTCTLRDRDALVVLDNVEHVLEAAPALARVLSACPALKILATSRAALRLRWEQELPLAPLAVPDPRHLPPLAQLARIPAVALFIHRARAIVPSLSLTEENAATVAAICVELDGLPLTLEVAATHVKTTPLTDVLARLRESGPAALDLLSDGPRDLPARQRSLRATLSWSVDPLCAAERSLFALLGVFAGGATLEAIRAVAGSAGAGVPGDVASLSHLTALVRNNLLQIEIPSDTPAHSPAHSPGHTAARGETLPPRFRMLHSTRAFACEQLARAGGTERARARHATYYLGLAERAEHALWGTDQALWFRCLEDEHDNLRAALRWTLRQRRGQLGLRIAGALPHFWSLHGHAAEGRSWLSELLALGGGDAAIRAKALIAAGSLARVHGDFGDARTALEEALVLARDVGDRALVASALGGLGQVMLYGSGDYAAARSLLEQGFAMWRMLQDRPGAARALFGLGRAALTHGDGEAARAYLTESLATAREVDDRWCIAAALGDLSDLSYHTGDHGQAAALLEASLPIWRELGIGRAIAWRLRRLGRLAHAEGRDAEALSLYAQSLTTLRELGDQLRIAVLLEGFAALAAAGRQTERALILLGAADALWKAIGVAPPAADRVEIERWLTLTRRELGEAVAPAWDKGQSLTSDQAADYALSALSAPPLAHLRRKGSPRERRLALTAREEEVGILVARGMTNRQIARTLVITESTVATHVVNILSKLDATSRAQIAVWVTEQGLLSTAPA